MSGTVICLPVLSVLLICLCLLSVSPYNQSACIVGLSVDAVSINVLSASAVFLYRLCCLCTTPASLPACLTLGPFASETGTELLVFTNKGSVF